MQIGSIFSSNPSTPQRTSQASPIGTPTSSSSPDTANTGGVTSYDFTSMTSQDLLNTVNSLVKSGQMSLKDSSPLIGIAQFGNGGGLTGSSTGGSSQPIDVLSALKAGIGYKQQTGQASQPNSGIQYWQNALATLQNLQGAPSGVDTYA